MCPGKRPESLDRLKDVKQPGYRLDQLLDGTLLGLGAGELNGRLLQAGPGIVPELPQAVVRLQVRASRHGHHLRDLPLAAQSCAASRLKATIQPEDGLEHPGAHAIAVGDSADEREDAADQ